MQLNDPLPGQERIESADIAEQEMAAFRSLMQQTGN